MSQVTILVGSQWGDEGKGKWCDVLSKEADLVVRFQGGNNAGHTLYKEEKRLLFIRFLALYFVHIVNLL